MSAELEDPIADLACVGRRADVDAARWVVAVALRLAVRACRPALEAELLRVSAGIGSADRALCALLGATARAA